MGTRAIRWFGFRPLETMIDAGLSVETAYALVQEFANTSVDKQRSMLKGAVRSAATISDIVIKTANKQSIKLQPAAAAAFCRIVTYYDDPAIRRQLARLLGKQEWSGGIPLLGYLLSDEDETVKKSATSSLDKLDHALLRVLTLPENIAIVAPPAEPSLPAADHEAVELHDAIRGAITAAVHQFAATRTDADVGVSGPTEPAVPSGEESARGEPAPGHPAQTIQRLTCVDFSASAETPRCGQIALYLKVKREGDIGKAVDIRVREGEAAAALVVHASSAQFKVAPEIRRIKVPRNGDSDKACFAVEANGAATGNIVLTIFDETRLVGSVRVAMDAIVENDALVLRQRQVEVFRDAGSSACGPGFGMTIQVSLAAGADGHICFHAPGTDDSGQLDFFPLGSSPQSLLTVGLQDALSTFRKQIQEISDNLSALKEIGASSREDAFRALEIKFDGLGRMIYDDLLSVGVQAVLNNRAPETVVHWVIKDDVLDAIPWEFAFQKLDASRISEPPLLVRFPVWAETNGRQPPAGKENETRPGTVAYLLGADVVNLPEGENFGPERFEKLMKVLRGANAKKFELKPNFSAAGLTPVSITTACTFIGDAGTVHMLCHGVSSEHDLYLQLTPTALGRVRPSDVYGWRLPGQPLVFVNACSSGAAGVSAAGFTTFGKSFLHAGASVYIGTLAPVVTETALEFATRFFNGLLGEGLSVANAMNSVRKSMKASADPNWRLYSIYGDLQAVGSSAH